MVIPNITTETATLISGLIGGIVGSLGNYLVQILVDNKRRERSSDDLRASLISEIESMRSIDTFDPSSLGVPSTGFVRKNLYENSSDQIGQLSRSEAVAVINFYGGLSNLQSQVEDFKDMNTSAGRSSKKGKKNQMGDIINQQMADLKKARIAALQLLQKNMNKDTHI
ncbi:hypothetical protein [Halorussus halophilus]|uniref:hypothetical protein n=1 Tax=Halorussus halophilus TaxID=2650975 RepID=UPI0013013823|nr:hypothetical protein [Halorussus halophilus]